MLPATLTNTPPPTETPTVTATPTRVPSDAPLCDFNGDHIVDSADIGLVGLHWGERGVPGWVPEDLNKDAVIDIAEVGLIGLNWQKSW